MIKKWKTNRIKSLFLMRTRLISVYVFVKLKVDKQLGPCNHIEAVLIQEYQLLLLILHNEDIDHQVPC